MSTTIQHVAGEMSSAPITGQPFNFNGVLEAYLIPRVVAADKKLPPGARLLWGVIRQHSYRDGRCCASDESLGRLLAVSDRQTRRYLKSLETAGLLRTTQRAGKTPVRELLWDSRFAGKIRPGTDTSVRGGGHLRPGGRTDTAAPLKEVGSSAVGSTVKSGGVSKVVSPEESALATRRPPKVMTEAEYRARGKAQGWPEHVIERDLQRFRDRAAKPNEERMVKAAELKPSLEETIRR